MSNFINYFEQAVRFVNFLAKRTAYFFDQPPPKTTNIVLKSNLIQSVISN
ncbi:hypothetical protein CYK57_00984 [Actinobacillus pleuropneumoniae]|nr:hypothetical protein appser2_8030 [Actinobacillus pleuropneumoniae serovar 2 str. S1536]EFM90011.1 hypothetical protein appser4_8470 [Actinobacillus pleuropneumoniae serovar 4 str. M62]EFM94298.1 hypothetical protein appser9_8990 [Actinobacillus pleuropneumoniae serovar 9 str. CVJ13261]EFM96517.1 hypothetical protein appser10_8820 [Actinobacillus pleuropneumoniae serovar 10 str. D13039]EFM98629.1 hypothetical protein appser11_9020 [Actinobacillus pleuropneumoniae serovar 11 str. 56153]EFN00